MPVEATHVPNKTRGGVLIADFLSYTARFVRQQKYHPTFYFLRATAMYLLDYSEKDTLEAKTQRRQAAFNFPNQQIFWRTFEWKAEDGKAASSNRQRRWLFERMVILRSRSAYLKGFLIKVACLEKAPRKVFARLDFSNLVEFVQNNIQNSAVSAWKHIFSLRSDKVQWAYE